MTKRIVLCADDYGQAPHISQGIVSLLKYGRLSATSCMVNTDYWLEHAKWLTPFQPSVDIGLHLNLTEGKALSSAYKAKYGENLLPLKTLLTKALFRQLDSGIFAAEINAQIDRFIDALHVLPDFIDGHHHVHQFPVVRDALLSVYEQRFRAQRKPYVRFVRPNTGFSDFISNFKKLVILFVTGGDRFATHLDAYDIPHNSSFAGIYPFSRANQYRELFIRFLKESDAHGLIMCHPGLKAANSTDPIAEARYLEYQYLFGDQFLYDCHQQNVVLGRFY